MSEELDHENHTTRTWCALALSYPEVNQVPSCVRAAFKVRQKGFLYIGADEGGYTALLKLAASLDRARELESAHPEHYQVGSTRWVTIKFSHDTTPPDGLMESWIDESYRLAAPAG